MYFASICQKYSVKKKKQQTYLLQLKKQYQMSLKAVGKKNTHPIRRINNLEDKEKM